MMYTNSLHAAIIHGEIEIGFRIPGLYLARVLARNGNFVL